MPNSNVPELRPASFFVLRTPLLAYGAFEHWTHLGANAGGVGRRVALRDGLWNWVQQPLVSEALTLASPDLAKAIGAWRERPDSSAGARTENALVRYFLRMTTRPTPFGLFAAASMGHVGMKTRLALQPRDTLTRVTEVCGGLIRAAERAELPGRVARDEVALVPNPSLGRVGSHLRYVESTETDAVIGEEFKFVSVRCEPHIEQTLELARSGCRPSTLAERVSALLEGVSVQEAYAFVMELVDNQMLLPRGGHCITRWEDGPPRDDLNAVIGELRAVPAEAGAGRFEAVERELRARVPGLAPNAPVFHVQMHGDGRELTLGRDVVEAVRTGIRVLERVDYVDDPFLETFRDAFVARYDTRAVPLLEAIDPDLGIGLGEGEDLRSPLLVRTESGPLPPPHSEHLSELVLEAAREGRDEIVLTDEDVDRLEAERASDVALPRAFAAVCELLTGDEGLWVRMVGATGESGAKLISRFATTNGALCEPLRALVREEERANGGQAMHAELIYSQGGKLNNVISRPRLREWEIPILGEGGAPHDKQIHLDDLWLFVAEGRLCVWSKVHDREVRPHLTTAHNHSSRLHLPVYRLLCALQHQGANRVVRWSWAQFDRASRLPRVRYRNCVLSPRRWAVQGDSLKRIATLENREERAAHLGALLEGMGAPRRILLGDAEAELEFDLANPLCVDAFLSVAATRERCVLLESFKARSPVVGPDGTYAHELMIPFIRHGDSVSAPGRPQLGTQKEVRLLRPGSDCLYFKIYGGRTAADEVLHRVSRLLEDARRVDPSVRWFFIRYGDPQLHLRFRVFASPTTNGFLLSRVGALFDELRERRLAWRFQLDTYEREVERYGGFAGLQIAETIFCVTSAMACDAVALGGDDAARVAQGIDQARQILAAFGLSEGGSLRLVQEQHAGLGSLLRANAIQATQLSTLFRRHRASLEAAHLRQRVPFEALHASARDALALARGGDLSVSVESFAASVLHMQMNRVLRSDDRSAEYVVYDHLIRLMRSDLGRRRASA